MSDYPHVTLKSFIAEDLGEYFFAVDGNPHKKALVVLPGFTGTHSDIVRFLEGLSGEYFVISPDFPGWGKSPKFKKTLSLKNYALYVHSLLQSLAVAEIYLLGHCMGATVAIEFALLYPKSVKKLILVSTPYNEGMLSQRLFLHLANISTHSPKFFRPLLFFWRNRLFSAVAAFLTIKYRSFHKKVKRVWWGIVQQPHQDEEAVEENWVSLIHFNYDRVRKLTMPTLLIHGEEDFIVSPAQAVKFRELFHNASLEFIPKSGHLPPLETPGSLARLVKDFLEDKTKE